MATAVRERLDALSRAHELTRPGLIDEEGTASKETTLHTLIQTIFAPYITERSKGREGIILTGCDFPISESSVTNVSLFLNELATNAAKYGALSSLEGVVYIDCSMDKGEFQRHFSTTPRLLYSRIRFDAGRVHLFHGKLSVKEIAGLCGFGSASAFCRAFRMAYGASPLAYRRQHSFEDLARFRFADALMRLGDRPQTESGRD